MTTFEQTAVRALMQRVTPADDGFEFDYLPSGAYVLDARVHVRTPFNSNDINRIRVVWLGGEGHTGEIMAADDVTVEGPAEVDFEPGFVEFAPPGDTATIILNLDFGEGTADEGDALVVIEYVTPPPLQE